MEHVSLFKQAKALEGTVRCHRRRLHAIAEPGFAVKRTNAYIEKELSRLSIPHRPCGGGIVAHLGKGTGGVLLRADTDALPIREMTEEPFCATGDAMHACGHDMHTAMLLGAAELLKGHEEELCAPVTLMLQPAEELLEGAALMLSEGVLEKEPRAAFALHVLTAVPLETGTLLVPPAGEATARVSYFSLLFVGRGSHGAMPHLGIDPLSAAAHTLLALDALIPKTESPKEEALLSVGFLRGGESFNAVPDEAALGGSLRTHDERTEARLLRRIETLSKELSHAFGVDAFFTRERSCPSLLADATVRQGVLSLLKESCPELPLQAVGTPGAKPTGGSEDFAFVSRRIPSLMLSLAAGEEKRGYTYPLHHPRTAFDEAALPYGTAAHAAVGLYLPSYLQNM